MPTGYTAGVGDGSITTFEKYALQCARAFGATITMRDDPSDAEIPEAFEASPYHAKKIEEATARLKELEAMTPEQCEAAALADFNRALDNYETQLIKNKEQIDRYKEMLKKAKAFKAPTGDHKNFAEFLVSQLEESIKFDDSSEYLKPPARETGLQWRGEQVRKANRDIEYHTKAHREELERTNSRNQWIAELRKAIAAVKD